MLREGRDRVHEHHRQRGVPWKGNHVMYFETGQGSALSAEAHHGVDQVTLEARAYGVARVFEPFLVNSVVGFIGPEYLYDERQIIRAGLEDHFMGKLLGLPMGCDVCYTNHAAADQNSADNLLLLLGAAGCNYFMGVPCSDDVMLNYQSTSYHDALAVRRLFQLRPAPEFLAWLQSMGIYRDAEPISLDRFGTASAHAGLGVIAGESGLNGSTARQNRRRPQTGLRLCARCERVHRPACWQVAVEQRIEPIHRWNCARRMPRLAMPCVRISTCKETSAPLSSSNGISLK